MADFVNRLIVPTVNLNGTDGAELVKQLVTVKEGLDKALEAMQVATPHGRDYLEAGQLQVARRAWFERTHALSKLASEVIDLAIDINKQMEG